MTDITVTVYLKNCFIVTYRCQVVRMIWGSIRCLYLHLYSFLMTNLWHF